MAPLLFCVWAKNQSIPALYNGTFINTFDVSFRYCLLELLFPTVKLNIRPWLFKICLWLLMEIADTNEITSLCLIKSIFVYIVSSLQKANNIIILRIKFCSI